ncbi:MAG TPA: VOC family protein [Candidatus Saccharimonadales bacterium]|nr:VOC family protein [Candidatus Saccharimonadales bacterium]
MPKITPSLWFDDQAEEAAEFYTSVFKNSKILKTTKYTNDSPSHKPIGSVLTVYFQLDGQDFAAINGGPEFKFNESISFMVPCENQEEIDYYWEKLSAVPESEICGWCKDKFGVSWQIVPKNIAEFSENPKAMAAILKMKKLDINELEQAATN